MATNESNGGTTEISPATMSEIGLDQINLEDNQKTQENLFAIYDNILYVQHTIPIRNILSANFFETNPALEGAVIANSIPVPIDRLQTIINENLIQFQIAGMDYEAVSCAGLSRLESELRLIDVAVLQIAMTSDQRISKDLKRQLFYGLLKKINQDNFIVIREDERTLAPIEDKGTIPGSGFGGNVNFIPPPQTFQNSPPGIEYFRQKKQEYLELLEKARRKPSKAFICNLIAFLLEKLNSHEDSLKSRFRLKSYASVMNKIFYRGRGLTDLFAATATTQDQLLKLHQIVTQKGATLTNLKRDPNGNGCDTYKYVRCIEVNFEDTENSRSPPYNFFFPVYYEIVYNTSATTIPHDQYELTRLECKFADLKNKLEGCGCKFETPQFEEV